MEAFSQLTEILKSLRSGLYVISEDLPDHGYYVSKSPSEKNITFSLCSISRKLSDFYGTLELNKQQRLDISVPASNVRNFLTYFLKHYTPLEQKPILAYEFVLDCDVTSYGHHNIFINRSANVAMWEDGKIFPLKHGKCIIREASCHGINFTLKDDNKVILRLWGKKQILQPMSVDSLILWDDDLCKEMFEDNWEDYRVEIDRKVCQFNFLLEDKERISVCVKTRNPYVCWYFRNQYLFNTLSKSIMDLLSILKNNGRWGDVHNNRITNDILNLKRTTYLHK